MIWFKGYTKRSLARLLVDGTLYVYGLCSLDVVPVNNWGLYMTGFCPVARELVPSHTYAALPYLEISFFFFAWTSSVLHCGRDIRNHKLLSAQLFGVRTLSLLLDNGIT